MNKHLLWGIAVSAVLVYFAARGVSLSDVLQAVEMLDYSCVVYSLLVMLLMQLVRSFRWGLLLKPLTNVGQLTLFSITSVGFLAIVALPARLGEFVRPYIIAKKKGIKMSAAMSSVVMERLCDGVTIMLFAAMVPLLLPAAPPWLIKPAAVFFAVIIVVCACIALIVVYEKSSTAWIDKLSSRNPSGYAGKAGVLLKNFIEGLVVIKDIKLVGAIFAVSVLTWVLEVIVIYYMLLAFGISLPLAAYLVLMVILVIAIAIPAAPGFIGSWHFACVLALSFFGIQNNVAFAFGVVYHFFSMILLVFLGLLFLPANYLFLSEAYVASRDKHKKA